uniref:Ribosome-inactivating protein n=1 Tax=Vernicia fordii TaxID=73154 RepID=A0A4D6TY34_VERFO|nr:RIP5 [Vernicia fordii]
MFESTYWAHCSSIVEGKNNTTINYQTVNLVTNVNNRESYTEFLQSLRDHLASGEQRHGIPVLRDGFTLPDSQLFLLVDLSNSAKASVTLALDVTNTYVVAYLVGNQSYFFNDVPDAGFSNLFTDTQQNMLPFGSSFDELEIVASKSTGKIDLGLVALEEAISSLNNISSIQKKELASELVVVIQMVSVAARFKLIEQQVRWSSQNNQTFRPDASLRSLEKNWITLSTAIQESNEGVFSNPVQLQRSNNKKFNVHSVSRELVSNLALMFFICTDKSTLSQFSQPLPSFRLCADDSEPTVRIIGRNGLCVNVSNEKYHNHNPVHLWPCKPKTDANQLWTLKRDGTIQSNGKCLNVNGYFAGNNMGIHDCENATNWEVWDNGTIINPQSGLVLTAKSEEKGTILTVEKNMLERMKIKIKNNQKF